MLRADEGLAVQALRELDIDVGPEHLLLGLSNEGAMAGAMLAKYGADLNTLRDKVAELAMRERVRQAAPDHPRPPTAYVTTSSLTQPAARSDRGQAQHRRTPARRRRVNAEGNTQPF